MWIVWRSNPSVKSHRSKTIKSGKNKVTLSLSILNISLMWHKHFFLVVSMRKLSPACYTIQAFPYQVSANGRWVIWSIDHFFCHMMVSWPHIIHILPGYTKCNCYQLSFWLILFLGQYIQPAEAEDSAQRAGQQRLPSSASLMSSSSTSPLVSNLTTMTTISASGSKEPPSPDIYWPLTMGAL